MIIKNLVQSLRMLASAVFLFTGLVAMVSACGLGILFLLDDPHLPGNARCMLVLFPVTAAGAWLAAAVLALPGQRFKPLTLLFVGLDVVLLLSAPVILSLQPSLSGMMIFLFLGFACAACFTGFLDRKCRIAAEEKALAISTDRSME